MSSERSNIELLADPSVHWGSRLILARQKKGWSIDNVAIQLKLKPEQIMAMESGDSLSICPDPSFAKAYVRSYAELVGLSESSFSDADLPKSTKNQLHSVTATGESFKVKPFAKGLSGFFRWMLILLLVAVVVWQVLLNTSVLTMISEFLG